MSKKSETLTITVSEDTIVSDTSVKNSPEYNIVDSRYINDDIYIYLYTIINFLIVKMKKFNVKNIVIKFDYEYKYAGSLKRSINTYIPNWMESDWKTSKGTFPKNINVIKNLYGLMDEHGMSITVDYDDDAKT